MRIQTAGDLRRVDVAPLLGLLPALRDEWRDLHFDVSGCAIDPLVGDPTTSLTLLGGRHRQRGARYQIAVATPAAGPSERDSSSRSWRSTSGSASAETARARHRLVATLRDDDARQLAFSLSDETEHWIVDVVIRHAYLPSVEVSGRVDLTALLRANGTPGCLGALFGGKGGGNGVLDLGAIERGGAAIEAEGRANRFQARVGLEVRPSATSWAVIGAGTLRARGLGRPVLWFAGPRLRRHIGHLLAEFWESAGSRMSDLEHEMARLQAAIDDEGGPRPFIQRALWDDDFDPLPNWR